MKNPTYNNITAINNNNSIGGQGQWLMAWLVWMVACVQMRATADDGLAINNNQQQNGDGDGVGNKSEGRCVQTRPGTTHQQQ